MFEVKNTFFKGEVMPYENNVAMICSLRGQTFQPHNKLMKFSAWNVARMEKTAPTSKGPTTLEIMLRMDGVMINSRKSTITPTQMSHSSVANAVITAEAESVSHTKAAKVLSLMQNFSVSTGTKIHCAKIPRRLKTTL